MSRYTAWHTLTPPSDNQSKATAGDVSFDMGDRVYLAAYPLGASTKNALLEGNGKTSRTLHLSKAWPVKKF